MLAKFEYWCSVCDHKIVASNNPTTGKFFQVYGCGSMKGGYGAILLAVCPDCSPVDCLKEVNAENITWLKND